MRTAGTPSPDAIVQAARRLVATYTWHGVAVQWIVERVQQRLAEHPGLGASDLALLCEQAAGEALYQACTPQPWVTAPPAARIRLEQGYRDLGYYLMQMARGLPAPVAGVERADLVQITLIAVYNTHATCRNPAQFLAWATRILYNRGRTNWRAGQRETGPRAAADRDPEARPVLVAAEVPANPLGDQELLRTLHDCLDTDDERMLALCLAFGLKRRELGLLFDRPLAAFDTLGRQVKRKLRRCGPFRALFDSLPPLEDTVPRSDPTPEQYVPDESARARLRAWVWDIPSAAEQTTPEYARYEALLPALLAGTLDLESADARWFHDYLATCDPCQAEYEALQQALAVARAGWAPPPAPLPIASPPERAVAEAPAEWIVPPPESPAPDFDLSFLREEPD